MLLPFLFGLALAGKLEAGWRGIPYGDATVIEKQPTANCIANPEPYVRWRCIEPVGGQDVTVSYMVSYGIYTGVYISCKGFTQCEAFFRTVSAAWIDSPFTPGKGAYGALPNGFFGISAFASKQSTTCASWNFNPFTDEGSINTMQMILIQEVERRKKAEAMQNAQGL